MTAGAPHEPERWLEPDRRELSLAAAAALADPGPLSRVRALAESGGGLDKSHIKRACASGYFIRTAEGEPLARACVVGEEWGRVLAPEPWVEANVLLDTLRRSGSASQRQNLVPDLLTGHRIATWAGSNLPGYWERDPAPRVTSTEGGLALYGKASAVQHAADADWVLVAARDGQGISQFLIPAIDIRGRMERREGMDLTRARYDIVFDGVSVAPDSMIGARGGAAPDIERQVQVAIVLALSQTVGSMCRLLELAIAHAKSRIAFGRPIGSFQAVKHLLVDASLGVEMSAAMRDAAAGAVDASQADASEILSMAKSFVSRTGIDVAHAAWQVFGGIAYMWENDFHLYLRRITADAAFFGSTDWHNERICALHDRSRETRERRV